MDFYGKIIIIIKTTTKREEINVMRILKKKHYIGYTNIHTMAL